MRRGLILVLGALVLVGTMPGANWAPGAGAGETRNVIVTLRDDVDDPAAAAEEIARREGLEVTNVFDKVMTGFAARVPAGRVTSLSRDKRVLAVEPDRRVWAFAETLPTGVDRIGADTAGEGVPPPKAGKPVAVLDTGISKRHPDLNVVGGHNCTSKKRKRWNDRNGHGSHVAGIIGAKDNGDGVVGVAPGTPLYAVRVLGSDGSGLWSWVICGLDWVAKKKIPVANLSLGGDASPQDNPKRCRRSDLHRAVCKAVKAGVTVVVAAGNDKGADAANFVPAMYKQVTTVSALSDSDGCAGGLGPNVDGDPDDSLASYSSVGAVVDVAAPGTDIRSTWKGRGYRTISGTSMAAPHVAAAYALGWNGTDKEPGPIPGDNDGFDEGILNLSPNTACDAGPAAGDVDGDRATKRKRRR